MDPSIDHSSEIVPGENLNTITAVSIFSISSSSRSFRSTEGSSPDHSPLSDHKGSPAVSFGIPFSWEQLPGIPKKQTPKWRKDKQSSSSLSSSSSSLSSSLSSSSSSSSSSWANLSLVLPPPPSTSQNPARSRSFRLGKKSTVGKCQRDPFIAALVECSKDDDDDDDASCRESGGFWIGSRLSRSLSDRFGLVNAYMSCSRSCAVSQSIIGLRGKEGVPAQSRPL
ncbi:hypothetical protein SAY87_005538 [Trapa incisa]|uniref:Uncharacterized protein n=1 Tax=Trapa incisa TaxID=236973 RepID=A0AAN7KCN3_9MYRT|nr:hypothetical protein SAY87_005538 [Trapa incisa]